MKTKELIKKYSNKDLNIAYNDGFTQGAKAKEGELKRMNYKYEKLSNKYNELKQKLKEIKK